jgi:hypothetical protein
MAAIGMRIGIAPVTKTRRISIHNLRALKRAFEFQVLITDKP